MTTLARISPNPRLLPEPELWMEFSSARTSATLAHTLISGESAIVHGATTRPRVKLQFLYENEQDALECEQIHAGGGTFRVSDPDRLSMGRRYVVVGEITRTLEPTTADLWTVTIDTQEISS